MVKDLNTPSTYYKKFEWDMCHGLAVPACLARSGMQTKKDFAVATLLKGPGKNCIPHRPVVFRCAGRSRHRGAGLRETVGASRLSS